MDISRTAPKSSDPNQEFPSPISTHYGPKAGVVLATIPGPTYLGTTMMKHLFVVLAFVTTQAALGATIEVESKGHYVPLNQPATIDLGDGRGVFPGYRRHITAVGRDGKIESHWCSGTNVDTEEEFEFGAGYCTVFDEEGDAYWTWFVLDGLGSFEWEVMGGTGKYKGSSGDGISTTTSSLPDGTAVFSIIGKIELSDNAE